MPDPQSRTTFEDSQLDWSELDDPRAQGLLSWTRELLYHPHLHCVVTAGGLDEDDQWRSSGSRFLLSVKALGRLFRGKLLDALRKLHAAGKLDLTGPCAPLADPRQFKRLMSQLYAIDWVVYAKRPFAGADHVYQ